MIESIPLLKLIAACFTGLFACCLVLTAIVAGLTRKERVR